MPAEVHKVSKTGAEVSFGAACDDFVQVRMKDVGVYAKQAAHDGFDDRAIVVWELGVVESWEQLFVGELLIDPVHEQVDVFWSGHLDGCFVAVVICPQILVLRRGAHDGTRLRRALIAHGSIDEVDLVEKVDDVDANPFVGVISIRDDNRLAEVARV